MATSRLKRRMSNGGHYPPRAKRSFFVLEKRKREPAEYEEYHTPCRRPTYSFEETQDDIIRKKDDEINTLKADLEAFKSREEMYKKQFQRLHAELQRSLSVGNYRVPYVHYVDAF